MTDVQECLPDSAIVKEPAGELILKGFQRPVPAFNVLGTKA